MKLWADRGRYRNVGGGVYLVENGGELVCGAVAVRDGYELGDRVFRSLYGTGCAATISEITLDVGNDGPVEVTVPAGTQYGQTFRLPGRGMPNVRTGRRGDEFVVVQVVVPKDLTADQKTILRRVGGLTGKPEKVSKGFFEKLREAINLD